MYEMKTPEIGNAMQETPDEASTAMTHLLNSLSIRKSRRSILLGGAALAGIAAGGMASNALALTAHAQALDAGSPFPKHFDIVETGEALAATFYMNGTKNIQQLGLKNNNDKTLADTLKAIWIEEELHRKLAHSLGSNPAADPQNFTFSFPHGQDTFTNLGFFLDTMKTIEELTNGALLQFLFDVAKAKGSPRLVQLLGQLTEVEGGHRIVEQVIRAAHNIQDNGDNGDPFTNWAFAPVPKNLNNFITDVPAAVKAAGFLSPQGNNSFTYQPLTDAEIQAQIKNLNITNTALPTLQSS